MSQQQLVQAFDAHKVRIIWDDQQEKYYFSIVDVVQVLTEQDDFQLARNYWKVLKNRLLKEGNETVTNCNQLKMPAPDGKMRLTDVADTEQVLRLVQSIPSKKAEPVKQWLAQVGQERLNQMQDPERGIHQAIVDFKRLGYSEKWINQRVQSIKARKDLTDEWQRAGVQEGPQYATLTDIITKGWSGLTTKEYKNLKGLRKESLRDNMTTMELALNMLAEATTAEISRAENPKGFAASAKVAQRGGKIVGDTRKQIEAQTGKSIVTSEKASDYIRPIEDESAELK